jgi:hypothetical protein
MQESSNCLTLAPDTLETPQPTIEQYQRLWLHVLRRTVEDADEGKPKAIQYLTTPNEGLEYVCELAGVERKAVLERSRKRYLDIGAPALAVKQGPGPP